jgi:3-deoxy-D-manno-octulosonate 8-phosphate phosphatase (KDO 8-P phosphatase)
MVGRNANPLLIDFAKRNQLVDYITFNDGAHHAVREMTELLIGLSGKYDETMSNRAAFSPVYTDYLAQRNIPNAQLFTVKNGEIIAIDRH